ncbi:cytidylyltransferase domain-containing protein [Poritiphilus flavus]|uniref:Spore coat polysaccharide biosynthesis protein SpsF n=1 Tax=Poritiphilus flavus TaxID=2697053 RepID=A0A6L9E8T3_9FLAO|nr:NTP transferase domain-containing protein [Poritiphilus flavus]NAS10978.1 hypothetical protein [Poritiphilus flavus]
MTGIAILCRYNSSRLPGKILKQINGKEILTYILERLSPLTREYPIVVCTSTESTDDPIADFCAEYGVKCFRGDLDNVALRFLNCAREYNFDHIVRINGDNIFLDPSLIAHMISTIEQEQFHFISNVKNRTYPKGMSVEIVNVAFYEKCFPFFQQDDLEHVMTYFYRQDDEKIHFVYDAEGVGQGLNFAIDTPEDFSNASSIISSMEKDHTAYGYREIIEIFEKLQYEE